MMKPWDKILDHFDISVTTVKEGKTELLFATDPKCIVIPKGAHLFNGEKDPVLNIETKKREITKYKIKIANKIIRKVFQ